MKAFKIILKSLLFLVFVISVTLNILLFNSSYGSLMFKYDKNKFYTMNYFATNKLTYENLLSKKDFGLQT